jgi:hypothetical protein
MSLASGGSPSGAGRPPRMLWPKAQCGGMNAPRRNAYEPRLAI